MTIFKPSFQASILLSGLTALAAGCVVGPDGGHYDRDRQRVDEPHEGYYDRDAGRWYHDHAWHDCLGNDEHCR